MAYYFPADINPYSQASDFIDFGSKFVCGPTCCTVVPTAPAHGVGVYGGFDGRGVVAAGARRGPGCNPVGWAEVGWLVSAERRPRRPRRHAPPPPPAQRPGRRSVVRRGGVQRRTSWSPRREFCDVPSRCSTYFDDDDEYDDDYDREFDQRRRCDGPLSVGCRVRRYRLYARPAYGWCGSFDVHQWQYAVTDETVPKCDAIFIVLRDDPRARGRRRCGASHQPLESGELVFIPGEPDAFRVHLYSDDYVY